MLYYIAVMLRTTHSPRTQGEDIQSSVLLHIGPIKSGTQVQLKVFGELVHVPPLRQGLKRHKFKSISQFLPCIQAIVFVQWYYNTIIVALLWNRMI